MPKNYPNNIHH